jgi:hypothetical protein
MVVRSTVGPKRSVTVEAKRVYGKLSIAIDSANSSFGWSSLGKPTRLPAAVNSLSCSAECRPPLLQPYCLCAFMALARLLIPAETLLPTCPQLFWKVSWTESFGNGFFGTRRASNRDAVCALNPLGEERTSCSAPNFGCLATNFWNTA